MSSSPKLRSPSGQLRFDPDSVNAARESVPLLADDSHAVDVDVLAAAAASAAADNDSSSAPKFDLLNRSASKSQKSVSPESKLESGKSAVSGRRSSRIQSAKENDIDLKENLNQDKSSSPSPDTKEKPAGATPLPTIISIVKNVVGAGLLPLPLTLYTGTPMVALAVMLTLALTNSVCFWLLGVLSEGKCSSYTQVWERCVGKGSRVVPILAVAINGTITCVQ